MTIPQRLEPRTLIDPPRSDRMADHYLTEVKDLAARDAKLHALVQRDLERLCRKPEFRDASAAQLKADLERAAAHRERVRDQDPDAAGKLNVRALALAQLHEQRGQGTQIAGRALPVNPPTRNDGSQAGEVAASNLADRVVRFTAARGDTENDGRAGSSDLFVETPSGVLRQIEDAGRAQEVSLAMIVAHDRAPPPVRSDDRAGDDDTGGALDVPTPVVFIRRVERSAQPPARGEASSAAHGERDAEPTDGPAMTVPSVPGSLQDDRGPASESTVPQATRSARTAPSLDPVRARRRSAGLITQPVLSGREPSTSGVFRTSDRPEESTTPELREPSER